MSSGICIVSIKETFEDTKGVIRSRNSKDRQYNGQTFEDTKEVIRSHNPKDRQCNGQTFEDTKGVTRSRNSKDRPTEKGQKVKFLGYGA